MSEENTAIKAKGILYTQFGSFSGNAEIRPSLCLITFFTTASSRLNNSLLSFLTNDRLNKLKEYCGTSMACKTELSGTGIITFYMFQVNKVILSHTDFSISSLHVLGQVRSRCTCFLN